MIDLIAQFVLGFFLAVWIGFFLGVVEAWNPVAYFVVLGGLGAIVIIGFLFTATPENAAAGINWALVIGTVPGYLLSVPAGKWAYREKFGTEGRR